MIRQTILGLADVGRSFTGDDRIGEQIQVAVETGRLNEDLAVCGMMGNMVCRLADDDQPYGDDALTLKHLMHEAGIVVEELPISPDNQSFIAAIVD